MYSSSIHTSVQQNIKTILVVNLWDLSVQTITTVFKVNQDQLMIILWNWGKYRHGRIGPVGLAMAGPTLQLGRIFFNLRKHCELFKNKSSRKIATNVIRQHSTYALEIAIIVSLMLKRHAVFIVGFGSFFVNSQWEYTIVYSHLLGAQSYFSRTNSEVIPPGLE